MKIQKVNFLQETVDYPCLETDYVIEALNKFANNKDFLEFTKNIEKVNVFISSRKTEPIFLFSDKYAKKVSFVKTIFFIKKNKEKYTIMLKFDSSFFKRPEDYTEAEKKYVYCDMIRQMSMFLKDIQKRQETEYEEEMKRPYLAQITTDYFCKNFFNQAMIKLFLLLFLISCKSKTQLAINDNIKLISQAQNEIQEIKVEVKQCNNPALDLKVNVLEKQLETLKYNNEKIELLYVAEIKQYKIYKNIVYGCFILGCLFMATKMKIAFCF